MIAMRSGCCALLAVFVTCAPRVPLADAQTSTSQPQAVGQPEAQPPPPGRAVAIFAGGCFWCMEGPFEELQGVDEVLSGYTGGSVPNPTYERVGGGQTGHREAVRVVFDPSAVTYPQLLDAFWRSMDPTDADGQFADRGSPYAPAIFAVDAAQRADAEQSKAALAGSGRFDEPIVVPILDAAPFYVAEDYHQDYYRTHSAHYRAYRRGSGREGFLERVWGAGAH